MSEYFNYCVIFKIKFLYCLIFFRRFFLFFFDILILWIKNLLVFLEIWIIVDFGVIIIKIVKKVIV